MRSTRSNGTRTAASSFGTRRWCRRPYPGSPSTASTWPNRRWCAIELHAASSCSGWRRVPPDRIDARSAAMRPNSSWPANRLKWPLQVRDVHGNLLRATIYVYGFDVLCCGFFCMCLNDSLRIDILILYVYSSSKIRSGHHRHRPELRIRRIRSGQLHHRQIVSAQFD